MDDWVTIRSAGLTARINPLGAELSSLTDADGRELMTDADPAFWTGRAPLLFPIVGGLAGDRYRYDGREYAMPKHGFARHSPWAVVTAEDDRAVFRLTHSAATLENYPFAFRFDMAFVLDAATLTMTATIANTGDTAMPFSFGYHPAFAWPLPYGAAKEEHRVDFAADEPAALAVIGDDGIITDETRASPLAGRSLALRDDLFERDALIWNPVESRRLRYGADDGPALDIAFDAPMLGIWTKPGAHYLCIEPWWGIADRRGFDGGIRDKPGIMLLNAGERRDFTMSVRLAEH